MQRLKSAPVSFMFEGLSCALITGFFIFQISKGASTKSSKFNRFCSSFLPGGRRAPTNRLPCLPLGLCSRSAPSCRQPPPPLSLLPTRAMPKRASDCGGFYSSRAKKKKKKTRSRAPRPHLWRAGCLCPLCVKKKNKPSTSCSDAARQEGRCRHRRLREELRG